MPFTTEQVRQVFDKLDKQAVIQAEHTVALAEIKKDLDYGTKEFVGIKKRQSDFQETKEGLQLHLDRHSSGGKVFKWVVGLSSIGTLFYKIWNR